MKPTLETFFADVKVMRQWVKWNGLEIYVRRHWLYIGDQRLSYLALANIQARRPGKGAYTKLLAFLYKNLPAEFSGIYVECIMEQRFLDFHLQRQKGWQFHSPVDEANKNARWDRPTL